MRLSQKKNCNGCKGGWYQSSPFRQRCTLGFDVDSENSTGIPQEPCYKPMTNTDVSVVMSIINRHNQKSEASHD